MIEQELVDSIGANVRATGDPRAEFHGFSLTGTRTDPERYIVVLDDSWPYHQRTKALQNSWSAQKLADYIETRSLNRILVPAALGEAPFGPQRDYLYAEGTYDFIQQAGLAGRRRAAEAGKPIAAVTGSAGKSTFKAMLQAAYQACRPQHQVRTHPRR
ncbi:hypothetical protein [Nesterenkonia ebinurensis]|uniref:hypothetical protein n=1 Tax=Nesterenkonia ebinurensis TaxID=2608252 RepID=UPI00168BDC41|nr:hypothetical protein [Nesterenkonia ebinurensis]